MGTMAKQSVKHSDRFAGVGADAVRAKTGKGWREWFAVLDARGAAGLDHAAIARMLSAELKVPSWWCQMVTVGYEQARGLRQKGQRPDGYSVSASRTMSAPAAAAFGAWTDARVRSRWLGADAGLTVRKATPDKSVRATWGDGRGNVEVNLWPKGAARCQVAVQHSKLTSNAAALRMKRFWGEALDRLREVLEGTAAARAPASKPTGRPGRVSNPTGDRKAAARRRI